MVVPLKLTQFYGHSVPRPRIYDAVKYSDQRVDPPSSVNDALLSWATDAHWTMGGLSIKRVRMQGKIEGNVRKLRALVEEEDEGQDGSESQLKKEATSKPAEVKVNSAASKGASLPLDKKKRQRNEEESVEATPARKLRKREFLQEASEEGSPTFVPATEEKLQKKGRPRYEHGEVESAHNSRKKGLRSPSSTELVDTPSRESSPTEKRRETTVSAGGIKKLRGSKSPASNGKLTSEASPAGDDGRLTRSGKRASGDKEALLQRFTKGRPRARKILTRGSLAGDEEYSSENDDDLEAFLKEKSRPLRRSSRIVKEQERSVLDVESASGSELE